MLAAPNQGGRRDRDVFGGYASTQIVVKLRPEAVATPAARQHFRTAPHDADPRAALSGELRTAAANWRALKMRPAYSEPFADPALAARYGLDRTFVIEVPQVVIHRAHQPDPVAHLLHADVLPGKRPTEIDRPALSVDAAAPRHRRCPVVEWIVRLSTCWYSSTLDARRSERLGPT